MEEKTRGIVLQYIKMSCLVSHVLYLDLVLLVKEMFLVNPFHLSKYFTNSLCCAPRVKSRLQRQGVIKWLEPLQ